MAARVIDHIDIRASDAEASERFYDTVLPVIGKERLSAEGYIEWGDFALHAATDDSQVTRGLHVGFYAATRELVDAFHRAGTEAGYRDDGAPGPRPEYGPDYYGGFLLDPDGNSVEAVNTTQVREAAAIDHLWIRVADLAAAKRFYETVAPYAGIRLGRHARPGAIRLRERFILAPRRRGAHRESAPGVRRERERDRRRFPPCRDRGRLPRQRRARRATDLSRRLLRRLRVGPRWQQHRGGQSQPLTE